MEMVRLSLLQVMVLCVLMCTWMSVSHLDKAPPLDVIELFAGVGRCAKTARSAGKHSVALDVEYDSKVRPGAMDINTPAGYVFPGSYWEAFVGSRGQLYLVQWGQRVDFYCFPPINPGWPFYVCFMAELVHWLW